MEAKKSAGKMGDENEYQGGAIKRKRVSVYDEVPPIFYRFSQGANNSIKQNVKMAFFFDLN